MRRILVVEDNPFDIELFVEIIRSRGLTAEEANNGEEAIQKAEENFYDLVLMDIGLPGVDGVEAMHTIKSMPGYRNVPVIALTAYAMKGDRERFLASGFDEYISKPIDVNDFIRTIEEVNIFLTSICSEGVVI